MLTTSRIGYPHGYRCLAGLLVVSLALSGCGESPSAPGQAASTTSEDAVPPPAVSPLADSMENTPDYVLGISFDPAIEKTPHLTAALASYAQDAKAGLMEALAELGNDQPRVPYELSLHFEQTVTTPLLQAISADGSRYTGGAHGQPLVARFVWLMREDRQLTIGELIPGDASRQTVAKHVEQALLDQVRERLQQDRLDPALHKEILENAQEMIGEGTAPQEDNFSQYEVVMAPDGKIAAIRFVFPPYQVGPYSDGVQTLDVPASVLLPHVSPLYAGLFSSSGQ